MATKSENADIAVLQTQMSNVEAAVQRIETKIDGQSTQYVPRSEFNDYKKSQNYQKFFLAVGMLVIGSLVTYFVTTVGQ